VTQFLNGLVAGISFGGIIALIALGYVIIYRATHTLNFAQGALLLLGAYVSYWFSGPVRGVSFRNPPSFVRLPLFVAAILSMVVLGALGWLIERLVVRRFRGQPVFAVIMATLGVAIILEQFMQSVWNTVAVSMNTPFTSEKPWIDIGPVRLAQIDLVTLCAVGVITALFFVVFQRSKLGTAMKATAFDQEAAIAQGISPSVIFGASWAISAALAALAGTLLASGAGSSSPQVSPSLAAIAFLGFPAIVLGGVDSPEGAVLGGLIIGIVWNLFATYDTEVHDTLHLGHDFYQVAPFVLMIIVLLVRPAGLFGTKEVRRV
jgi:branched-chain amino acid transport system permease protein